MIEKPYTEHNSIKVFDTATNHTDYNPIGLDNLYQAEEKHFWFLSRKEFILNTIEHYITKTAKMIEVGAGTGNVSRYLLQHGYSNLSVGEMHLNGLLYAKHYGIQKCYQFNLLQSPFKEEFDCVCLFDVLEHIEDDTTALKNIHKMLMPKGFLILTVPTHMWLWSREDKIAGHKRRYSKEVLVNKLTQSNFTIEKSQFFFIFIVPLLFLRKILQKDNKTEPTEEEHSKEIRLNPFINRLLLKINRFENKLHHLLPNNFGGSILIIARKK